jgi:hypothetical protein
LTLIQSSEQFDKADRGAGRREALAALEFYAHADLFMNPTAEMADLVLLVASLFEREALKIRFDVSAEAQSLVQLQQPVIPPCGDAVRIHRSCSISRVSCAWENLFGAVTLRRAIGTSLLPPASRWTSCAQHRIAFGCRSRAAMPSIRPSTQMEYRGGTAGVQHAVAQA